MIGLAMARSRMRTDPAAGIERSQALDPDRK